MASCIAVYTLRTKAATFASKAWNAITKTATALQLAYGIAVDVYKRQQYMFVAMDMALIRKIRADEIYVDDLVCLLYTSRH